MPKTTKFDEFRRDLVARPGAGERLARHRAEPSRRSASSSSATKSRSSGSLMGVDHLSR
ncbi:MAG: hypothetical protein QOD66_1433 [Solirubrobacteraceae bacterium]|jgi:hypothetical protein|nr:hypothetical protein [Solirubrobacteraceae bacterium]